MLTKHDGPTVTFSYKGMQARAYHHVEFNNAFNDSFVKNVWRRFELHGPKGQVGTVTRYIANRIVDDNGKVSVHAYPHRNYAARPYDTWDAIGYKSLAQAFDAILEVWAEAK